MANFTNTVFYSAPWGEPTEVLAEYQGRTFDIREGWGCHEGWTNNYVALEINEMSPEVASNCLEMQREEVKESYTEKDIQGIFAALDEATK